MPHVKRYFQRHPWNTSFFRAQITQILLFSRMLVLERSKITVWEWQFFEHRIFFAMEVLHMCLTYLKRFFHLALKCVRFSCFRERWFWRDQTLQFVSNTFSKKKITMYLLGICLPYVKRYFQEHQWSAFFFRAQITQIMLFSRIPVSERSNQRSQFEKDTFFRIFFAMKDLYM